MPSFSEHTTIIRLELADAPTEEEVWSAVGKLRNGKAGGTSGILPEMMKLPAVRKSLCLG